ncbi:MULTISPECIES: aminoglycoside phosphotransferase family protein [unclassified Exiguobacterium]|uniref:phosphotransferase n=1 Tax=unclassified Exiguobacterium TaxID=2644629 RepID=UPI001BE76517|nr:MULTISPECIES: aminoglycoside phosphotransferase family protein [unclassified Exiguobacterium]
MYPRNDYPLIEQAVKSFGLVFHSLEVHPNTLTTHGKHGDKHYKILIDGQSYSIRLLPEQRYAESALSHSTPDLLTEQLRYTDYLRANGIPFMKRVQPIHEGLFTTIRDSTGKEWTCCLFHWLDGHHVTVNTMHSAAQIGTLARQVHDLSRNYQGFHFPFVDHTVAYQRWFHDLQELSFSSMPESVRDSFQEYLSLVQQKIDTARPTNHSSSQSVISTDLNSLNVLWDTTQQIVGIVDHEHIGATDRVQNLAWLIKWYTRTEGIASHDVSGHLAKSLLSHYNSQTVLVPEDDPRLASLLWLSGCFNLHFVEQTTHLLQEAGQHSEQYNPLQLHLETYLLRGERLTGLLS